jgi:hypothetical protein
MILTQENRRTRRESFPSATLSTTNPTWNALGAKPCLRGEKPASNRLSYGTGSVNCYCIHLILGNVPILKSTPLPEAGP